MYNTISFNDWLKSKTGKTYLRVSGILALLYSFIPIAKTFNVDPTKLLVSFKITSIEIEAFHYFVQIVFIAFVVLFAAFKYLSFSNPNDCSENEYKIWETLRLHRHNTPEPTTRTDKEKLWIKFKKGVNKTARQFVSFWLACWIVWLGFYVLLTINRFKPILSHSILNLANNINGLFFIFLFMTLSTSTSKYGFWQWARFSLIVLGLFLANLLLENNSTADFIFSLFSGLFAGLSMGAFIGSINSRTISIPLWALLFLNLYCAIQPLYVFFVNDQIFDTKFKQVLEISQTVILLIAFILKIILFLLVTWILQTGRLIHFIIQEGSLNYEKEDQFKVLIENTVLHESKLVEQEEDDDP